MSGNLLQWPGVTGRGHRRPLRLAALLAMVCLCAGHAGADPLNPLDFAFVAPGPQTLGPGAYTLNTGGTPSLTGPVNLTGEVTLQGGGHGIAVFSFESLTIDPNAVIDVQGPRPVALLARDSLTFAGTINANGGNGGDGGSSSGGAGGVGRAGGGNGGTGGLAAAGGDGHGPGFGGGGDGNDSGFGGNGAGGGFGGNGGGSPGSGSPRDGSPGVSYGNLLVELEAGSGGGGGGGGFGGGGGGGAGGGAVELGALGTVELNVGIINTASGLGGAGAATGFGGSASGGGVLVHGGIVTRFFDTISAGAGGNGGGGRVAIQSGYAPMTDTSRIDVAGGHFGAGNGVVTIAQATLTASDLDFGPVRVGESRTLFMGVQNTGDPDTSVNGLFPTTTGEFSGGNRVFSGLHPSEIMADMFTYAPTDLGDDSVTLQFLSNGGDPNVTLTGMGVGPLIGSSVAPGATLDVGGVGPHGAKSAALDVSNVTLSDPYLPDELIGLTLLDYDITGPDAALFDLSGFTAGEVLSAGDLSDLDVMLSGDGVSGPKSASLTIMTDEDAPFGGTGNSVTCSLSGIVVPAPAAWLMSLTFGTALSVRRRRRRAQ